MRPVKSLLDRSGGRYGLTAEGNELAERTRQVIHEVVNRMAVERGWDLIEAEHIVVAEVNCAFSTARLRAAFPGRWEGTAHG
jgi:hypothetical protein